MKTVKLLGVFVALMLGTASLSAKSFKDFLKSDTSKDVLSTVTGGLTLTDSSIVGTWKYVEPAVELSSESTLTEVASSVAATQLEDKLNAYCSKVGITAGKFEFVFNSNGTFTSNVGTRMLGGNYVVDSENGTIALTYKAVNAINIGTVTASATLMANSLSMLFPADNLLKLLSIIAATSSKPEYQALGALSQQYNGVSIGFSFSGKAVISVDKDSVADGVKKANNIFGKIF